MTAPYHGLFRGTVVNNVDPMMQGRIQVLVPDVSNVMLSSWANPCFPTGGLNMGVFSVPLPGSGVYVAFEQGDPDYPVWLGVFTGSPAVGKIVMAAAAKHLTSVTLELGGKSPVIVGQGADLKRAVDWITFGKFLNAGQNCISPDHLYVHASVKEAFLTQLRARIAKAYGSGEASPHLTRIITPAHAARLSTLIADAMEKGATATLAGGQKGQAIGPHLIEGTTPEMRLSREEIFGPILPVMTYTDLDVVIGEINARDKPLALYIFDRDRTRVRQVIEATTSGAVGVNLTLLHFSHANLPFGGVNTSGIGAAHGQHGFRAFSHERAVLKNRFLLLPLLFPPYGPRVMRLLGLVKRLLG